MKPLTLTVLYVIEGETNVTVIGTDHATGGQVAVVVDLQPRQRILEALKASGGDEAPAFTASGLTLALDFTEAAALAEARQ